MCLASSDPLYQKYHDEEWGVHVNDDRKLFEMLCLEGAQAGLSWITILRKRETIVKHSHILMQRKLPSMIQKVEQLFAQRWDRPQ